MSDREPIIRPRSRPNRANQQTAVDDQSAHHSQKLVERALETSLSEPEISSRSEVGKAAAGSDYPVGYKKPPVHTRFQKGHCPNPKGIPRKTKLSMEGELARMLDEVVTVMKDGKPCRMTVRQVGLQRIVHAYTKGDMKAMALVTQLGGKWEQQRAASAATQEDGGLQEPSPETLQLMADLKATELHEEGLSEAQVERVLSIFGLPPASSSSDAIIIEMPTAGGIS